MLMHPPDQVVTQMIDVAGRDAEAVERLLTHYGGQGSSVTRYGDTLMVTDTRGNIGHMKTILGIAESFPKRAEEPVQIYTDDRTNQVYMVGSKGLARRAQKLMRRLDRPTRRGQRIYVLPLKHAVAKDVAPILKSIFGEQSQPKRRKKKRRSRSGHR